MKQLQSVMIQAMVWLVFATIYPEDIHAATIGAKEYRYLKAIRCPGSYNQGGLHTEYLRSLRLKKEVEIDEGYVKTDRETLASFFLGPMKLAAEECSVGANKCILRGIVPVPIRSYISDDIESAIVQAMKTDRSTLFDNWNGAIITDRDRGIFDNMTPLFKKWELNNAKKQIFESMKVRKVAVASPYHAFLAALEQKVGLKVSGILLEVADTINEASLSLGAAVLFSKVDAVDDWKLTPSNYRTLIKEEKTSKEAKLIECYLDEMMGIHLASEVPVVISQSLYERCSADALLEQRGELNEMFMRAPFFDSERDQRLWTSQLEESRARPAKKVPKISEISDASTFLKMRLSEKRACLRSSGIVALPRPREGPKKVDALMIPLLDEEVAYEVLRRLGETRGDFNLAAQMQDFQSRKHIVAKQYSEAVRAGDKTLASHFCDELNALATLSFDPSNPEEETIKGGFDIEEWYWEQRKRIYGIVA